MLKKVYEGLNACSKVYSSKVYFCAMYPTCVSSKLCEFIFFFPNFINRPNLAKSGRQATWCADSAL